MTSTAFTSIGDLDSPRDVLAYARSCQTESDRALAHQFIAAVVWAEQHPPESIDDAATWLTGGYETGLPLAGPGAPLVAEFCIAEFALAIRQVHRLRSGNDRPCDGGQVPPAEDLGADQVW